MVDAATLGGAVKENAANAVNIITDTQKNMSDINSRIKDLTKRILQIKDLNSPEYAQQLNELKALNKLKIAEFKRKSQEIVDEGAKRAEIQAENAERAKAALPSAEEQRKNRDLALKEIIQRNEEKLAQANAESALALEAYKRDLAKRGAVAGAVQEQSIMDQVLSGLAKSAGLIPNTPGSTAILPTYSTKPKTNFEAKFPTEELQIQVIDWVMMNKIDGTPAGKLTDKQRKALSVYEYPPSLEARGITVEKFKELHKAKMDEMRKLSDAEIREKGYDTSSVQNRDGQWWISTRQAALHSNAQSELMKEIRDDHKKYPIDIDYRNRVEAGIRGGSRQDTEALFENFQRSQGDYIKYSTQHKVGADDCAPGDHLTAPCTPGNQATNKIPAK